ncbi:sulfatase-like hydrolase/transferase [Reichenbachiella sp. MALMAid0571]|uniref:sulfatase-like hydrolase/transferase n=1 Tax=Reichenbachiella sp. MALMAid0571 TaxID=3143939 RepID=UPI0032E040B2
MTSTTRLIISLFMSLTIACTSGKKENTSADKDENEPPNILILMPDQFRADMMGVAGHPDVLTPNIDQLAGDGIRFTNAISGAPVCCPTRATIQTGLYIHEHKVTNNNMPMDTTLTTIAELLGNEGYATGFIGKWHLDGGIPEESVGGYIEEGAKRQGWQDWNGYEKSHEFFEVWKFNEKKEKVRVEGYNWEPTWQTDMALNFIKKNTEEKKPWCYYIAYGPPHNPFQCPQNFLNMYDPNKIVLPPDVENELDQDELKEVRRLRQIYYGQVSSIDHEVGRLVEGLDKMKISDNTIVLFISDHGDILGSHSHEVKERYIQEGKKLEFYLRTKGKPYITALRTPLIIKWPAVIKPGKVNDVLVNSVDIAPTLIDLAGVKVPSKMSGQSMAGWCISDNGPKQDALYLGLFQGKNAWRGVWDGRFLYSTLDYEVLYDHYTDPYETKNLFNDPDYSELKKEMQSKLEKLAISTGDPIISEIRQ